MGAIPKEGIFEFFFKFLGIFDCPACAFWYKIPEFLLT
jgi:hypothetical protein